MMSRPPQLHTSVYPAIAPETIGQANKDKVAVVTGAARGKNTAYPTSVISLCGASALRLEITDLPNFVRYRPSDCGGPRKIWGQGRIVGP